MNTYLEDLIYQFRPFFYLALSIISMVNHQGSNLTFGGGVLLGLCALSILKARYDYRYGDGVVNTYTYHY